MNGNCQQVGTEGNLGSGARAVWASIQAGKGKLLSEFAAVAGYHRKHAIRLLNPRPEVGVKTVVEGARIYGAAVKAALVLIWEAADRICGKHLKAAIPHLVSAMERHGHLQLDADATGHMADAGGNATA